MAKAPTYKPLGYFVAGRISRDEFLKILRGRMIIRGAALYSVPSGYWWDHRGMPRFHRLIQGAGSGRAT